MIDFADLCRPQPGRVTVATCYRCHRPLHYRPADRTYFATEADARANRKPISKCPTCARELQRRNLAN
jgi:hypothetical protein